MPLAIFKSKQEAQDYMKQFAYNERDPTALVNASFATLIKAAQIERDGVFYSDQEKKSGGYGGNDTRYNKICEMIAEKLIHDPTLEKTNRATSFGLAANLIDPSTAQNKGILADVEALLMKKVAQCQADIVKLGERYPEGDPKRMSLVRPLHTALSFFQGEGPGSAADKLYVYKEALTQPRDSGSSILDELKQSSDPLVLRALKSMISTITMGLFSADSKFSKSADQSLGISHYQAISHTATQSASQATVAPEQPKPDVGPTGPKM